jgi:cellulose synthase/poly-beta-1,6-N-acetylglucosamine synthase-like glycosyltransferase
LGEPSKGSVPDIPDLDSGPITISVIVCAHNERQWLPACLHSVLAQSRPPDQLIADVRSEAKRAMDKYGMLVIPGAEITQNRLNGTKNSHVIALDIRNYISADQRADDILREIRKQDAISIACHPHHRTTRRIEISTCYLWDNRKTLGELVDLWEAANRDDLFSVTSLKHYPVRGQQRLPQTEALVLVEDAREEREELAGDQDRPAAQRRYRVDPVSQGRLGGLSEAWVSAPH